MTDLFLKDLLGRGVRIDPDAPMRPKKRKPTPSKGYAAPPGTGPKGETCKTCKHYYIGHRGHYRKCALMRARWTGGPGTDIKAGAPACRSWEKAAAKSEA